MTDKLPLQKEIQDKIRRWENAKVQLDDFKRSVNSAEVELSNAQNDLGKFLVPDKSKIDESFNYMIESDGELKCLVVTVKSNSSYDLTWRKVSP